MDLLISVEWAYVDYIVGNGWYNAGLFKGFQVWGEDGFKFYIYSFFYDTSILVEKN